MFYSDFKTSLEKVQRNIRRTYFRSKQTFSDGGEGMIVVTKLESNKQGTCLTVAVTITVVRPVVESTIFLMKTYM
jgi:hypothetical protein